MENTAMLQQPTEPQPQAPNLGQTTTSMVPAQVSVAQGPETTRGSAKDSRLKNKKAIYGLGITELVMGGLSIILTIIPLSITEREKKRYCHDAGCNIYTGFTYASPGIWGGILLIVAGIMAVRVKSNPSKSLYLDNLILAIITACATLCSTFVSGLAAYLSQYSQRLIAIHCIITVLNFASMMVTIIHACYCGQGVCCDNRSRYPKKVVHVPAQRYMMYPQQPKYVQSPKQQQYVQSPIGQYMPVYLQHVPAQQYPIQHIPAHQYPPQHVPAQQYPIQHIPAHQYPPQHVPAQIYPQSSAPNLVLYNGYQANNNLTAQTAPPPTYDNVDQDVVQIEMKPTADVNA